MTHHEVATDGGPTATLRVKGKDLTALMDIIAARRPAVPGDAAGAARAGRAREVRRARRASRW